MNTNTPKNERQMHLFSFSFWFIVKTDIPVRTVKTIDSTVYQFYRPYRTSPANENFLPISDRTIERDEKIIKVGYEIEKIEIYPILNDKGEYMTLQVEHGNDFSNAYLAYGQLPADSLRIDVIGEQISVIKIFNELLEILRIKSRQWWIGKLLASSFHSLTIDLYKPSAKQQTKALMANNWNEKFIDIAIWNEALDDLEHRKQPLPYEITLLDSIYYFANGDQRRSVLDLAATIDNCLNVTYERIWTNLNLGVTSDLRADFVEGCALPAGWKRPSVTFIPFLINEPIEFRIGKAFRKAYPKEDGLISTFWTQFRNPISHGKSIEVDNKLFSDYIRAIEVCVRWLEGL